MPLPWGMLLGGCQHVTGRSLHSHRSILVPLLPTSLYSVCKSLRFQPLEQLAKPFSTACEFIHILTLGHPDWVCSAAAVHLWLALTYWTNAFMNQSCFYFLLHYLAMSPSPNVVKNMSLERGAKWWMTCGSGLLACVACDLWTSSILAIMLLCYNRLWWAHLILWLGQLCTHGYSASISVQ